MTLISADVAVGKSGKADFDTIYHEADPREYFRVLGGLDYVIPDLAKVVFRSLIERRAMTQSDPVKVLDVGCSYGINSALIEYPLDIYRLAQRYTCPEIYRVPPASLARLDRSYFEAWPKRHNTVYYGVDTSKRATTYAKSVGLMKDAVTTNMETGAATDTDRMLLGDADLIISTGCVGYVTHRTFGEIMRAQANTKRKPPIVATFVLRMYPFDDIAAQLADHGLVTEKLEGITFVQRRFHSRREFDVTMDRLRTRGVDPEGKEADGLLHAELFVSRTEESIRETSLGDLISITSGVDRRYGRRFRSIGGNELRLMH